MTAVGEDENANAGLEFAVQRIQLVVDDLAIVENPGLVATVRLVAVGVP
jgi:hypothetical protein